MNNFQQNTSIRFSYNSKKPVFRELYTEAGGEDGTGCNRKIYGEQQEKDNV